MTTKPMHLSGTEIAKAIDQAVTDIDAAAPAVLTDNTGGAVTGTLASGITDTVAKNAIASLNAQINNLRTALINAGVLH